MSVIARLKQWARQIRLYVKCLALVIAGYALSPIDLIPDYIPVLGYFDDLLIIPLGLLLVIRLLPLPVLIDARQKASAVLIRPRSLVAAAAIIGLWIICTALVLLWIY